MQVIDEITRKAFDADVCYRVAIRHLEGQVIFGYIKDPSRVIEALFFINGCFSTFYADYTLMKSNLVFSKRHGMYLSKIGCPSSLLLEETLIMGQGGFPYTFSRKYEAIENFKIFKGKQKVVRFSSNNISKYLDYSFGIEFETSQGYIPESLCFRDGLIPLRDGSISGLEYSTVVLEKNKGICLLKQQLKTLKEYTNFNKECSLHIHFGGFPLEPDFLFRVYTLFKRLEQEFENLLPDQTFRSGEYKENGKNYCKKLPNFNSFDRMYEYLVGRKFFGDLTQPHPKDIERKRKWNVPTRYYALNFINALCYNVNKTIEFRFLRPTYNYNKILLWLYIFSALLKFAETVKDPKEYRVMSLEKILSKIYPNELVESLKEGIIKLQILKVNQEGNNDHCGQDISLEDKLFNGKMNF